MKFVEVSHPISRSLVTALRDKETQIPGFTRAMSFLGQVLFYEALRDNAPKLNVEIETPLEAYQTTKVDESLIKLVAVLRAGLGILDGIRPLVPAARCGMVAVGRDKITKLPHVYQIVMPSLTDQDHIFICEPMLATGGSALAAIEIIRQRNKTARLVLLSALACPESIKLLEDAKINNLEVYVGALDRELDKDCYIRPGLGDAGDRIFGTP